MLRVHRGVVGVVVAVACAGLSGCLLNVSLDPTDAGTDATDITPEDAGPVDATEDSLARFGENTSDDVSGVTWDTELWSQFPSTNYAGIDHFSVDSVTEIEVGLLRFELASISRMAEVVSAELEISTFDLAAAGEIAIHRVVEEWTEAATTWNERLADTAWSTPGGTYDPEPMVEFTITAELLTRYRVPLSVEVVQGWVADPDSNFGMRISGSASGHTHFASSQNALDGSRPTLIVGYRE
jgi:hypothetical protein